MKRYAELDLLRSLAVIGMIIYHAAFDLQVFYQVDINVQQGLWKLYQSAIASTFLLLVGISFAISYNRTNPAIRIHKFLKRGLIVLGCGMLVTLATYSADPQTFVRFGVLHCIGVSILLLPFFARLTYGNVLIAPILFIVRPFLSSLHPNTALLLPLGITPPSFQTVDYFPLIPWLGVILIGLVIGQYFYVDHLAWRSHYLPLETDVVRENHARRILTFPGRYALIIYMLHQPVLLLLFWLLLPQ